jgi:hypothetical protein
MFAVALRDVLNFNILPMFFEIFGNQAAMAVVRLFLATEEAATIQNFTRGRALYVSRPHQV